MTGLSALNPLFLSLLPLAALPVLFHLFFRLKRRPRAFSTLMFFHRLDPRLNARRRLREWLILLLRTLLILFLLLALAMGFEISPWINMLLHTGHSNAVFNAALPTAVGMGCLGIGAQIFNFDYRRVANYAYAALLVLVLVGVLSMFFHFVSPNVYSYATLAIFSVLVVVDFMRIRQGGDGATAVELALSIYLDGINIFLALTQIFSGRRD